MSKELGPVYYGSNQEVFLGRDYQSTHTYSEEIAAKIDKEVSDLLEEAHSKALQLLGDHRSVMDVMVRVLLECETIYSEEVEMIMKGASADEVKRELQERLSAKYDKKKGSGQPAAQTPPEEKIYS